jgi:uncharacterized protein YcaQ
MQIPQARRIALAAQGFADPAPSSKVTAKHFRRAIDRMSLLQLDSVQYLCRSHYLPLFSRLGPHSMSKLDSYCHQGDHLMEAWAHEASLVPVSMEPLLRWRKAESRSGRVWSHLHQLASAKPKFVEAVRKEVLGRGPLRAADLEEHKAATGDWWGGQSEAKIALEWLFRIGALGARRDEHFRRVFEDIDRVVPTAVRQQSTPSPEEAQRELLMMAAQSHGIGTLDCLADYFRIRKPEARLRLQELVEDKRLQLVDLEGVDGPVYRHPKAKSPKQLQASTMLSPFDPVVWNRKRARWLFDFEYRIEIYVPKEKRKFGYYVLPFLFEGQLAGRVELKAERKTRHLRIVGAWAEDVAASPKLASGMAKSVLSLAEHFEFDGVLRPKKGNLARALSAELR